MTEVGVFAHYDTALRSPSSSAVAITSASVLRFPLGSPIHGRHRVPSRSAADRGVWVAGYRRGISRGVERRYPSRAQRDGRELECGQEVVSFEVWIVGKDLFGGHTGRQKLDKRLHRLPQAANDRPTVTDGLVARDSVQVRRVAKSSEAVARKFHRRPVSAQAGVCEPEHLTRGR